MNIIGRRKLWYAISLLIIIPGAISLVMNGLRLGIDFRGGAVIEVTGKVQPDKVREAATKLELKDTAVITAGNNTQIRFRDPAPAREHEANHQKFKAALASQGLTEVQYDSVGPSVSGDITRNAFVSLLVMSLAIVLYISFAFRNTPPPVSPTSFGVVAIVALLHDTFFLLGTFSLLGYFFDIEVDALFVTAILTVIGFSVHDTIVVFDRVRENLRRHKGSFEEVVNLSVVETLARSLNTSYTVLLTLLALLIFGGASIRMFVLALLIGIASGTYSSIFNAAPLLVTWHNYKLRQAAKAPTKNRG